MLTFEVQSCHCFFGLISSIDAFGEIIFLGQCVALYVLVFRNLCQFIAFTLIYQSGSVNFCSIMSVSFWSCSSPLSLIWLYVKIHCSVNFSTISGSLHSLVVLLHYFSINFFAPRFCVAYFSGYAIMQYFKLITLFSPKTLECIICGLLSYPAWWIEEPKYHQVVQFITVLLFTYVVCTSDP